MRVGDKVSAGIIQPRLIPLLDCPACTSPKDAVLLRQTSEEIDGRFEAISSRNSLSTVTSRIAKGNFPSSWANERFEKASRLI